ncbi:MAG: MerR family transcriptional regulator [Bacteroidota bacterium]|nr:MerR family transcriptional regulator [Bacteroidota bacterium]
MDELGTKAYYKISEVAELLGVNTSLLRYWEKEFPQISPLKTASKRRVYNAKDIQLLRNIQYLVKVEKHTLAGAKKILNSKKTKIDSQLETTQLINKMRLIVKKLEILRDNLHNINNV